MSDYILHHPSNEHKANNYERRLHNLKMQALELSEGQQEPSPEEIGRIECIEEENEQLKKGMVKLVDQNQSLRERLREKEQSERRWMMIAIHAKLANKIGRILDS